MKRRMSLLGVGSAGLLAMSSLVATSQPASAQVVDDFLCSTFSYKCNQQKPLPPPQLAPGVEPTPPKHVAKAHKKKVKRTPAPAAAAPAAATPAPAPDAAPK